MDFIQLFLWFAIFQCLVITALLIKSIIRGNRSSFFLSVLLLAYAFKLLLNTDVRLGLDPGYYLVSILMIGPSLYLYLDSIVNKDFRFDRALLVHLVLPTIYLITIALFHSLVDLSSLDDIFKDQRLLAFASVLQIIVVGQTAFYLIQSARLVLKYRKTKKNDFNKIYLNRRNTLSILIAAFCLAGLFWILLGYGDIGWLIVQFGAPSMTVAYLFWMLLSLSIIGLGYYGLINPKAFIISPKIIAFNPNTIHQDELSHFQNQIIQILEEEEVFKNPELRMRYFSDKLQINPNQLSIIINKGFKKNFNDLINEYRIKDFLSKVDAPDFEKYTLLSLALDSGFNSKSTFNRAFKKNMGVTPRQYISSRIPDQNT